MERRSEPPEPPLPLGARPPAAPPPTASFYKQFAVFKERTLKQVFTKYKELEFCHNISYLRKQVLLKSDTMQNLLLF
jgi:hypothetical protein